MATYATLKADIAAWARRGDLTAAIPSFVAFAETEIFRLNVNPLRVREMETETTLTLSGSSVTVPSDYTAARYVKVNNGNQPALSYSAPEMWNRYDSGHFTVVGSTLKLPDGVSSDILFCYLAQPAALSSDTDTNAVLNAYPSIYLAAAMKYASFYVKDINAASSYQSQLDALLGQASRNNKTITAGSLTVRPA